MGYPMVAPPGAWGLGDPPPSCLGRYDPTRPHHHDCLLSAGLSRPPRLIRSSRFGAN